MWRLAVVVILGTVTVGSRAAAPAVTLVRLPAGGIQPQVAVDTRGVVHVVYLSSRDPANADVFYTTASDQGVLAPPVRVNSEPGSAIATGTVRGVRLAVGRNGRVHVAWNGSSRATPKGGATPMLYTRSIADRRAFEPERNLIQFAVGLDGGGAIAADERGRVFVAWHASGPIESKSEGDRRVWVTKSADDGQTFAKEQPASDVTTGACGCCGMDGLIDRSGSLHLLYRSARDVVHRDTYLLRSRDNAATFASTRLQEWEIGACPMSTFALAETTDGVIAAWETAGQVQFARVDGAATKRVEAPGADRNRRHPSVATNSRGEILLAWSEGTAWQKGGAVVWQVFDRNGRPTSEAGRAPGVPVWGLVAAYARRDGAFTIVY